MNRSFKFILSAALFLCGCSFVPNKVDATVIATQENCPYNSWMNYTVEQEDSNICVKFGDVTPLYLEKRKFENLMMQVINGTMSVDAAATRAMMSVDEFLRYKEEFLKRFK